MHIPAPVMIGIAVCVLCITWKAIQANRKEAPKVTSAPPNVATPTSDGEASKKDKGNDTTAEAGKIPERGSQWGWIIAIVIIIGLAANVLNLWIRQTSINESTIASVPKNTERPWEYILEKPPGKHGIIPDKQVIKARARLIEDSNKILEFVVYYDSTDETKVGQMFLDRSKTEGVWTQREPASEGHWQLMETQTVPGGYCIRINRSESSNVWANAFLIPK